MNDFQKEIYKTIDRLTEQKLKTLGFDKTKRGKIVAVSNNIATVQIDGEEYNCKLRRGIFVEPNDIVFVKFPQNNGVDKYVETVLGGNETPEHLIISAEEILTKIKTVDGHDSGLDADTLDGKHASEFATLDDLGGINVDISGDTIVQNINSSTSVIDDKNLSNSVNDAISNKHNHSNKSILDTITQALIDKWNNAWEHISDAIRHITFGERTLWNTVSNKADTAYVDAELSKKANTVDIPTKMSELTKDVTFDEWYYTENEVDSLLDGKVDNSRVLTDVPLNAKFTDTNTTYSEITTAEIDAGTSSTLRTITGRRIKYVLDKVSNMISSITKLDVGLGNVDNTSDLDKPISTATQTALNTKVDNSRVLTDVPTNAKFTDTIYTHPTNHPASMITGLANVATSGNYNDLSNKPTIPTDTNQLSKTDVYTKTEVNNMMANAGQGDMTKAIYDQNNNGIVDNAEKVNGFTVESNVPANAKFTDTIYTHPSNHPASMITGLPTKLSQFQMDISLVHVGLNQPPSTNVGWIDTSL